MCDSGVVGATSKSELQILHDLRCKYSKNLMCNYLNMNSSGNKMHELKEIMHDIPVCDFVISEIKLDESFQNAQLTMSNYEIRARRSRDKYGIV